MLLEIKKIKPGLKFKVGDQYKGPYLICEKGPNNTYMYKLVDLTIHNPVGPLINATQMKRYYDQEAYRPVPNLEPEPRDQNDNDGPENQEIPPTPPTQNHVNGQQQQQDSHDSPHKIQVKMKAQQKNQYLSFIAIILL